MEPTNARSTRSRRRATTIALLASDAVAIVAAGLIAGYVRFGQPNAIAGIQGLRMPLSFGELSFALVLPWVAVAAYKGLYDADRLRHGFGDLPRIIEAMSMAAVALILGTYALKLPGLSRLWLVITVLAAAVLVIAGRALISGVLATLRRRGRLVEYTLVVGSNAEAADIVRILRSRTYAGLSPIGYLASSHAELRSGTRMGDDVPCLGHAREIVSVVEHYGVDTVVIAASSFEHDVLARIVAELRDLPVAVHVSSGLFEVLTRRVAVNEVAGVPLISVKGAPLSRGRLIVKRAFDITVASSIVLLGLPLWVGLAATIKLTSPGPIFYRQERIGRKGRSFEILKFRSMCVDADERLEAILTENEASGPMFKMKRDPRVTPVGRWMRKLSLDEFPQLLNVLMGDMSLVGPRPQVPREAAAYTPNDARRLDVLPGMTGLWQVSGRSLLTFDEMVRLDIYYIENWSVGLDVQLLARTVPAVLFARGAF